MYLAPEPAYATAPLIHCYETPDDDEDTGTESDWNDRYDDDTDQPEEPDICSGCGSDVHGCTCD